MLAAALAAAAVPAGTALASTSPHTATTPRAAVTATAATATATTATEDPAASDGTDTTLQTSGSDLAGNVDSISGASGCNTLTVHAWAKDALGIVLTNYYMYTYWCWNGSIVTTHTTWERGSVTATGSATGWSYNGVKESSFNCYYANSRTCSGNHETSEGNFQACIIKIGCYSSWYPYINEYETYNGGWHYSYSG